MSNYLKYKSLFYNLLASELKLKYKNSVLGFLWTLIEPALIILILLFVFSNVFKFDAPLYAPYLITGFIAWTFFSNGTSILDIFVSKANLINKLNFPIEILVFSSFSSILILSLIQFVILEIVLIMLKVEVSSGLILLPVIILLQSVFVLGFLFFLSSLYVFAHDLRYIWTIILQASFFATPIFYPVALLQEKAPLLLKLNPMSYFISAYRDIMVYARLPAFYDLLAIFLASIISFLVGYIVFRMLKVRIRDEV